MISSALGGISPQGSYCHASKPPMLIAATTSVNSHDTGRPNSKPTATASPAIIHTGAVMISPAIRIHNTVPIAERVLASIFSKTTVIKKIISLLLCFGIKPKVLQNADPQPTVLPIRYYTILFSFCLYSNNINIS